MARDLGERAYWANVLKRVARRTRGRDDAEDLLHAAYLKLERFKAEHEVENPVAFLVHAAANIAVDTHRHERLSAQTDPNALPEPIDESPLQDEVLAARARLGRVREGLMQLSPRTREVFLMHRIDGLKYREIASQLEISQSAVEKHIAKAALFLTEWTEGW